MHITNISDARASLSSLIEQATLGEEVIIGKAGKPMAKLVPYDVTANPRKPGAGAWSGRIWIADDFDDPPEELLELFTGAADNASPP